MPGERKAGRPVPGDISEQMPAALLFIQNLHLRSHRKHRGAKHTNTETDSKQKRGMGGWTADQPAQGTAPLPSPDICCLQTELLPQKREEGEPRWPKAQGGGHSCEEDAECVLKPEKPQEIIHIASETCEWGSWSARG